MQEKFGLLVNKANEKLLNVSSVKDLTDLKVEFLGKNGEITALLRGMKDIAPDQRSAFGKAINELKEKVESLFNLKEKEADFQPLFYKNFSIFGLNPVFSLVYVGICKMSWPGK